MIGHCLSNHLITNRLCIGQINSLIEVAHQSDISFFSCGRYISDGDHGDDVAFHRADGVRPPAAPRRPKHQARAGLDPESGHWRDCARNLHVLSSTRLL